MVISANMNSNWITCWCEQFKDHFCFQTLIISWNTTQRTWHRVWLSLPGFNLFTRMTQYELHTGPWTHIGTMLAAPGRADLKVLSHCTSSHPPAQVAKVSVSNSPMWSFPENPLTWQPLFIKFSFLRRFCLGFRIRKKIRFFFLMLKRKTHRDTLSKTDSIMGSWAFGWSTLVKLFVFQERGRQ